MYIEDFLNLKNGHEIAFHFKKNNEDIDMSEKKADISIELTLIDIIRKQLTIKPYCSLFKNNKSEYLNICASYEDIEVCNGESINYKILNFCSEYIAKILKSENNSSVNEMKISNYIENEKNDNVVKQSMVKFL